METIKDVLLDPNSVLSMVWILLSFAICFTNRAWYIANLVMAIVFSPITILIHCFVFGIAWAIVPFTGKVPVFRQPAPKRLNIQVD